MKKIWGEWKKTVLILLGILGLGLFLRIYKLTSLPIFVDEAIYVRWAQVMANEPTLRFLPLSDGKQPLYMWILMFLIKYFSNPLFIARLISVLSGLITTLGIFTFSYLLFKNKKTSLLASFLYVFSPFTVFFDRMALVDSMLSMFGIWTVIFSYLSFKEKRLDFALIAGLFLGFTSLTKSPALIIAFLLPSTWLLTLRLDKGKKKNVFESVFYLGVIYLLAFLMYNVQRLGPNFELLSSRTGDYVYPLTHLFTNTFDPLIPHLKDTLIWFSSMGTIGILVIWLLSYFVNYKKYKKEFIVLSLLFLVPVFFQSGIAKVYTARYIFYTLPFFFILAGQILNFQSKKIKNIFYLVFSLFIVQSFVFIYYLWTNPEKANLPRGERSGYLEEWSAGQGIGEIAQYLQEESKNLKEGEKLVVGTEGYFGTLPDGLQIYTDNNPNIWVIGVGLVFETTPEPLQESVDAGNRTFLVVNKSRFHASYEDLGYKLIKSYPKALRLTDSDQYSKYGPQEELYLFEL